MFLHWLLLLEEYGVTFEYLPGKKNFVADNLSRLDIDELMIPQEEALTLLSESEKTYTSSLRIRKQLHLSQNQKTVTSNSQCILP